jgi:glycogen(starch) synthase
MRILFWSSAFLPQIGGIGVLAAQFLPAMRERGYEYIVVSSQGDRNLPSNTTQKGIPVHRFPFWQSLVDMDELVKVKLQVAELKQRFAPDLIHINGVGRDEFFHLVTASAHPAPLLVTLHGEWVLQADAIVRRTLQNAAWVVGCSNAILDKGQRLAPEIVSRSSVIHNAIAETSTLPEPLSAQAQRLICIGRLSKEKGFDLALSAFASIVTRFPDLRLVIVGDGPERMRLAQQAAEIGLKDAIDFVGWVAPENVPGLINTATVVVMPSRAESLPVVALQTAQMARPVVGTRVGGLPEVVLDQETGLLVDKENPEALAKAIAFLLAHRERATRMGQAARDRVQRDFDWERHVNAYDRLYNKLMSAGATASLLSQEN